MCSSDLVCGILSCMGSCHDIQTLVNTLLKEIQNLFSVGIFKIYSNCFIRGTLFDLEHLLYRRNRCKWEYNIFERRVCDREIAA